MNSFLLRKLLILTGICILTYICFSYTQYNQFTNWDDDFYVTNDPYIKEFTPHNLKVIFTEDITKNNYHPLCMLSLAVNYHFSQLNPHAYYLTNIFIHIANVIMVFFLILIICARLKVDENSQLFIASFAALWFGVHPMRVESVSWIAERKDVLYAFFYFAAMLCYFQYTDGRKMKWYWATFVLFALSCLSKPMAVVFPFSLLCIDLLMGRLTTQPENAGRARKIAFNRKVIISEKAIFFIASLICGGAAFYTQNKTGAVASFSTLTLSERFMYASYGFVMYIWKLFNPTYLSTFYPYPFRYINGSLQSIYYLAPLISLAILAIPFIIWKKKPEYFKIVGFGIGYFFVNVMFVLQFISVGAAIMADRYSYVAYFGLFFLLAYLFNQIRVRVPALKVAVTALLLAASGGLAYGCYQRTFVWHNSETLLTDAIDKYPLKKDPDKPHDAFNNGVATLSYKWRGNYYFDQGDYNKALDDYNVLVLLRSADAKIYDRIAVIYGLQKNYQKAMETFTKSLEVQNNVFKTYVDRCMTYVMMGDTINAFKDYIVGYQLGNNKAEQILSDSSFSYVQHGKFVPAILQYDMLLKINPNNPFYYFYRGVAYYSTGHVEQAINDWEVSVKYNVQDTKKSSSNNLCVAYDAIGKDSLALHYLEIALATGNTIKPEFAQSIREKAKVQSKSR